MELDSILERIDLRLKELDLSDNEAQNAAHAPGAISNIRRAVKTKTRQGISTRTLTKLAEVLKTTPEWLLRGEGAMDTREFAADIIQQVSSLGTDDSITLLTWTFQFLVGSPEDEARLAARAVLRAFHSHRSPSGEPLTLEGRRELVDTAVRLVRP
jgi:hypothetical protein